MLMFIGLVVTILYIKRSCKEKHARFVLGARGWRMVRKFREQDDAQLVARAKICWTAYQIIAQTSWTLPNVSFPEIFEVGTTGPRD